MEAVWKVRDEFFRIAGGRVEVRIDCPFSSGTFLKAAVNVADDFDLVFRISNPVRAR